MLYYLKYDNLSTGEVFNMKKYIGLMLLGLLFVLSLTACTKNLIQPNTELKTTDELKKFNTKQEIMDFLDTAQKYNSYNYY